MTGPPKDPRPTRVLLPPLAAVALLAAVASWMPDTRLWGVNHLAFYTLPVRVIALALVALAFVPPAGRRVHKLLAREVAIVGGSRRAVVFVVVMAVLAVALFTAFHSETLLLGDGQLLETSIGYAFRGDSTRVAGTLRAIATTERIAPGASVVYYLAAVLVVKTTDREAVDGVRLATFVLGGLFVAVMLWIVFCGSLPGHLRLWLGVLVLTSGTMELFFGYVEYYAPFILFGALYVVTAWRVLHARGGVRLPVVFALLAAWTHVQGILFLPSLAWLLLWRFARAGRPQIESYAALTLGALTVLGTVAAALVTPLGRFFLPWVANDESYGILSPVHWLDIANELLLVLPALPLFIVMLIASRRAPSTGGDTTRPVWFTLRAEWSFMWLLLLPCFVYLVAFYPEIGMARDWDLFTIVGFGLIPLALLAINRFVRAAGEAWIPVVLGPAFVLSAVLCAGWIGLNTNGDQTATRLAGILEYDPLDADYAYENLRAYYYERNRLPEALVAQEKAVALSKNPRQILNLATLYGEYGDIDNAVRLYRQILKNRPLFPRARERLILTLYSAKRYAEVAETALDGTKVDAENPMYHYYLGKSLVAQGDFDASVPALLESRRLGPPPSVRDDIDSMLARIEEMQNNK